MKDITCPYCDEDFELCHDDGAYTDEGQNEQWECPKCNKISMVSTSITFSHEAEKADCLNGGEHKWTKRVGLPVEHFENKYICWDCNEEKTI